VVLRNGTRRSCNVDARLSDASTFTGAVQHELPALFRLAARLGPPAAADDVVQEALIRAWRYRDRYDPRVGPVANWLLKIVANESHRAAARTRQPLAIDVRRDNASVDERLDLEAAVRQLPRRQRLAVDCYYYADLSISQTAAVMKCNEGTVKSVLADARESLRRLLQE
jgi:RNA polymerase sigma factor (sigma-70 family)